MHDIFDGGVVGHVDGFRNGAGNKRLHCSHHLDVTHVVNRPAALLGFKGAIKNRQVLILDVGRALDGLIIFDVIVDLLICLHRNPGASMPAARCC